MSTITWQHRSRCMVRTLVLVMAVVLLVGCQRQLAQPMAQQPENQQSAGQQPTTQQSAAASLPIIVHLPHHLDHTLLPTPIPVSPFPLSLEDQISTLQVHDRFFYDGNPAIPEVALTFDDGPNPPYTGQVLAILQRYGLHATFFCVGSQVAAYPDLARQEIADGHTIGNHTWSHPFLTSLSDAQIKSELTTTGDIIEEATGIRPIYFRPPYGAFNARVLTQANQLGLTTFIWSDDSLDWAGGSPTNITHLVLSTVTDGAIILMHDGGGNRSRTVAALPNVIDGLLARHFRIVTLDQLIIDNALKVAPTPFVPSTVR
jgi:peptidoglycan-N-acetylglucosamine deacetylase